MTTWGTAEGPGDPVPVRWARLAARRRWIGLGAVLAVLSATAAVLLLSRPVWRGEARLRLSEPPAPPSVSPTGGIFSILRPGGDPFANDLELLGSRTVAEEVTGALALDARVDAPRGWYRDSLFVALESLRTTDEAVFELTWEADDRIRVDRLEPSPETGVASGSAGGRLRFGGLVVVPGPRRVGGPASVRIRTTSFGEAADRFRGALDFERSRRDAYVLDVSYDHSDPAVAEAAVAAAVDRFVALRGQLYGRESDTTTDSLRVVVEQTAAELARAEAALEALQRESGLVAPEAQGEAFVERWVDLQADLAAARAELALAETALERTTEETSVDAWTALLAHPRFVESPALEQMLGRRVGLEEQRLALAFRRSPGSQEMRVLGDQIRYLDESLRSLALSHARSLRETVADLEVQERRLDARLAELPRAAIEVGSRQRDVRLLTEVLVLTEQRLRQEEVRRALAFANVQVVDPPALRFEPVWPREKLGAAVGLLLALGTGLLAMVVVDRADMRVRRAADLRDLTGAPVLATTVAPRRRPDVTPAEAEALRSALPGVAEKGMVLCGLEGREDAEVVARVFGDVPGRPTALRTPDPPATPDDVAPALGSGSDRVVLVVRYGRTDRRVVRKTVELFREAGGQIVGSVLLCGSRAEAEAAWT